MNTFQTIPHPIKNTSRNVYKSLLIAININTHPVLISVQDAIIHYNQIFNTVFVGQKRIASKTGYSLRTVNWAVRELHKLGWLRKDYRHRHTCVYTVNKLFYKIAEQIKHIFPSLKVASLKKWLKQPFLENCVPYIMNIKDYLKPEKRTTIVPFVDDDNGWLDPHEDYVPLPLVKISTNINQILVGQSQEVSSSSDSSKFIDKPLGFILKLLPFIYKPVVDNHPQVTIIEEILPSATEIALLEIKCFKDAYAYTETTEMSDMDISFRKEVAQFFWKDVDELFGSQLDDDSNYLN